MYPYAKTPEPPYYAVIFTAKRTPEDDEGYGDTADLMVRLASEMDGYLGIETARSEDGVGITVSYWRDEAAILAWKKHVEHTAARNMGRSDWYSGYELRVAKVERAYGFRAE